MTLALETFLDNGFADLESKGLLNTIDVLDSANGPIIEVAGKKMINLASNNYLGFATRPELIQATKDATDLYGAGAGAVRTINGTLKIHRELEEKIAEFKGTEAAIAFQSAFNCNMGAIAAVMKKGDAILSDSLNHASIIDGCRLSGAKIIRVEHQDMADLEAKAKEAVESGEYNKIMYITDGVFSMDGDIANLPEIVKIAEKYNLITYVDDAHGSGVTGNGAGTVAHFGLQDKIDFQMGCLSKAIGVVGGYIAGSQKLIDWLQSQARPFLFSTSLTPGAAAAAKSAFELMHDHPEFNQTLLSNGNYFKEELKKAGFNVGNSETSITPVILGDEKQTQEFSRKLIENGVYAKPIVFPTVPLGTGRVRAMPTAAHTKEMLDDAVAVFTKVGKEMGLVK